MPCLGRPFQLGMLYDCRDDRLVPGVTLWDYDTLQAALDSRPQEGLEYSIVTEDSIESKTASLGVDAGLKLSCLGGLVSVSGSAKFLDDQRSSKQQARVSLKYSTTSRFEQLTMQHLAVDKIKYPQVFDNGDATHVVTAALYGADAFFTFDREVSSKEKYRDIHGSLQIMIKKLPSISIEGHGELDMKDNEKNEVKKFQCRFHGDFILPENPTTFEEAVKVYKQLPQILAGDAKGSKFIPQKVWLYPLCKLDSKAAKLVREISVGLVNQMQKLLENLQDFRMQANDMKNMEIYLNFPGIQEQLSRFTEMVSEYETDLARKVSKLLPQIRGGGAEEAKLADVFKENHASPFNHQRLSTFLQGKVQERKLLETYTSSLKCDCIEFLFNPGDVDAVVTDMDIDYVLCFAFTTVGSNNPFLDDLFSYLRTGELSQSPAKAKQWFQDKVLANDIKNKAKLFKTFAQLNKGRSGAKFAVIDVSEEEDEISEKGAEIFLYKDGMRESYMPPGALGKPIASSVMHDTIVLEWPKPMNGAENVVSYSVSCQLQEDNIAPDQWVEQDSNSNALTVGGLNPETTYLFKVRANCEIGVSSDSDVSDPITTIQSPHARLPVTIKSLSGKPVEVTPAGLEIYKLPLVEMARPQENIVKFCIGDPRDIKVDLEEKVLMVVGATGAGKSTLINGIANYILGVQWEDGFRFKLIVDEVTESQAFSQTQNISSYSFPLFEDSPLPYQLTVVDTPGFGDTRGLERDEEITACIKTFFSMKSSAAIDHLNGIGFVAQSSLARLTHTQKYIIDSILSVFGRDIAENVFMMTTFADGAYPPVMGAITTHIKGSKPPIPLKVETLSFFKFNNSALFNKPTSKGKKKSNFDEMYWDVGYTSFEDFFQHLGKAKQQSLSQTRKVLDERSSLQTLIQGVQEDIRKGMNSIDLMRQEKRVLEQNEAAIKANKDFTYMATEHHTDKETLPSGTYVTNCMKCNRTCHNDCAYSDDKDKKNCSAMDSKGYCKVCVGHCNWQSHVNNSFRYVDKEVQVKKHYADLEKKYKAAEKGKASAEGMIMQVKDGVEQIFRKICKDISMAQQCLDRLEQIALVPNPLTEVEYINLLIKSEENEHKDGWEKRVKCYEKAREMAVIMSNARKGELSDHMNLGALMDDLLKDVPIVENPKTSWRSKLKTAIFG